MKISYVISMKGGVQRYNYREIEELIKLNQEITVYPTKYTPGPYMPEDDWGVYVYNPLLVIMRQILYFCIWPKNYIRLLILSIKTSSFVDFIIGSDFAFNMKKRRLLNHHT